MKSGTFSCPLCTSRQDFILESAVKDFEYGAPGEYRWMQCQGCQLIRLDPVPTPAILAQAYPPTYHSYVLPASRLTRQLRSVLRKKWAQRIVRGLSPDAAILDIGCSRGDLLQTIGTLGSYRLYGVEYNGRAAEEARQKGVQVWEGDIEKVDIPAQSMDVVVMHHVLEHVFDGVKTMQKVQAVLKPGGTVTGELPNIDSWDARLFGRYWGGGHAPRHLWHFTPATLRQLLAQCEFEDIHITPALHTGHWALSIQNALRRNNHTLYGLISGRAWYYPLFLVATLPINLLQYPFLKTGVMQFTARKPK